MPSPATTVDPAARRHRPKTLTVFAAAFIAGAALAYGVDRVLDVHVVKVEPQIESVPIFVALRSLPQGSPVTIWDVALKDWPKAMLPTTALQADASFDGMVLRHPIRTGQPLLSVQLVRDSGPMPSASVAMLPPATTPGAAASAAPARTAPAAPTTAPEAAERFVPATPAAQPAVASARDEAPVAPAAEQAAVQPLPESVVAVVPLPTVPAPPATSTDIDAAPPADPEPDETPAPPAVSAVVESVPEPMTETPTTPLAVEPLPDLVETDEIAVTVAADPAPLAAPVPALPSTDIARSLAEVGRTNRGSEPEDASVLDRTTEALPPVAEQKLPKQHLVIPERIALAADASFTEQPVPVTAAEPATQAAPRQARQPAPAATPPARTAVRKPDAAQPAARQPARNPRQPAGKPQSAAARFWNAWMPQASGGSRPR